MNTDYSSLQTVVKSLFELEKSTLVNAKAQLARSQNVRKIRIEPHLVNLAISFNTEKDIVRNKTCSMQLFELPLVMHATNSIAVASPGW